MYRLHKATAQSHEVIRIRIKDTTNLHLMVRPPQHESIGHFSHLEQPRCREQAQTSNDGFPYNHNNNTK